jgi:hypothetical protein
MQVQVQVQVQKQASAGGGCSGRNRNRNGRHGECEASEEVRQQGRQGDSVSSRLVPFRPASFPVSAFSFGGVFYLGREVHVSINQHRYKKKGRVRGRLLGTT